MGKCKAPRPGADADRALTALASFLAIIPTRPQPWEVRKQQTVITQVHSEARLSVLGFKCQFLCSVPRLFRGGHWVGVGGTRGWGGRGCLYQWLGAQSGMSSRASSAPGWPAVALQTSFTLDMEFAHCLVLLI